MTIVRIIVPAHNEQARLGVALSSILASMAYAQSRAAHWRIELVVVTDRCTDDTASIAGSLGALVLVSDHPGKVAALLKGMQVGAIHICIDADVAVGVATLFDLVATLLDNSDALAACPMHLKPQPLRSWPTLLAWALWRTNDNRGFSQQRHWLSGRCYAVRELAFPPAHDMALRASRVPAAMRFVGIDDALKVDDIWLSRSLIKSGGEGAIVHVDTDPVCYRAPSTWQGMSRTWQRLRRELRRIDMLFPELPRPPPRRAELSGRSLADRMAWMIFRMALWGCQRHALMLDALERMGVRIDHWPVVIDSKQP